MYAIRTTTLARALAALVAAVALAAVVAAPASAHGDGLPAHAVGQFDCGQGLVHAYPPRQMLSSFETNFRNPEMVFWTPVLYRYNESTRGWDEVTWAGRWYRAFTSSYGFYNAQVVGGWTDTVTNNSGVRFVPFANLTRGYYAVGNWMYWSVLKQYHFEPSSYCYVQ